MKKKRYIGILFFLSFFLMIYTTSVTAQRNENEKTANRTIESVVTDEAGNPVKGAVIYGNEGTVIARTDASGKFTIIVRQQSDLFIESDGYQSVLLKSGEAAFARSVTIKADPLYYTERDIINVGFNKLKRGDIVNAVSVLFAEDILQYDNNQSVTDAILGRVPGMMSNGNMRGIGAPLVIVDGLPRDISHLRMSEVDQITFLKDINSSILYGSDAVNGVIHITTKRGQAYKNQVNVTGFYGMAKPIALPKYLSSSEYMSLNNEARINDGLDAIYSQTDITNFASGSKYRYPSVDYYSNEYIKSVKPFWSAISELSGGTDNAQYYANLGWDQQGSLLNFGAGEKGKDNRFNLRGNVDIKINNFIKSSLDAVAVIGNVSGPVGTNYWTEAATLKPHLFVPLLPIDMIDPANEDLIARKNDVNGMYLLGGTSSFLTNPIANGFSGGRNEDIRRNFSIDNRIDFDLQRFVKGLGFHTSISMDLFTSFSQSVSNQYSVYEPQWNEAGNQINSLVRRGNDVRSGTQGIGNSYYERRFGGYGMFDYDRIFGSHQVTGNLLLFGNMYNFQGNFQGFKNVNLGMHLGYRYKQKYLFDFSSNYANSIKLPKETRRAFSPSLGISWVISKEDLLSSVSAIDFLKLRVSAGINNSDREIAGFYYWENVYFDGGQYYWFDGTHRNMITYSSYGGNPDLGWEKRMELNFGFEGVFFNKALVVDANIFTSQYSDQVTRPTSAYPSFYNNFLPYMNFDNDAYRGAEMGLTINRKIGNLRVELGANMLYAATEVLKKDEIYANDYQYRTGRPTDALFGLVADGFFRDYNDINSSPLQLFGTVKPGDIKYVDQNNDGNIDSNDEIQIGRYQSPFSYGLNLKVSYRNFTFLAMGYGSVGSDASRNGNYYWVDGDDKYSEVVLGRWTETNTATATFPRLSSTGNNNNFRNSTFWLYKNNYFKMNRMQVTYQMPAHISRMFGMKNLNVFADGSALFTISKVNIYRDLSVGAEPYYRTFSLGAKTIF
jgi:TonB-linked SusC/RagA family outer membrane protein